jgi:hypothetical protein
MTELYRQCWQAGPPVPGEYESKLADALEAVFSDGHYELSGLVEALNKSGSRAPDGAAWTAERFQAEMRRLGA